jgi:hypothetical protein
MQYTELEESKVTVVTGEKAGHYLGEVLLNALLRVCASLF